MANTEVYLIRHGLPEYELDEQGRKLTYNSQVSLSEEGRNHVETLTKSLPILDVLYTSPFTRARETADIIARLQDISEVVEDFHFEDISSLNSVGMLLDDVVAEKVEPHVNDESLEDMFDRVKGGFTDILKKERGKKVGIVSHGHPIRLLVWKYLEGQNVLPISMQSLISYNYPIQAETWVLIFNEVGELSESHLITREDNEEPGRGKW